MTYIISIQRGESAKVKKINCSRLDYSQGDAAVKRKKDAVLN